MVVVLTATVVVLMLRTGKIKKMEEDVKLEISRVKEDVFREISRVEDETTRSLIDASNDIYQSIEGNIEESQRYTDSRIDKALSK